jgi:hypothetical protein
VPVGALIVSVDANAVKLYWLYVVISGVTLDAVVFELELLSVIVPVIAGKVITVDPATAGACKVIEPEVSPEMTMLDII